MKKKKQIKKLKKLIKDLEKYIQSLPVSIEGTTELLDYEPYAVTFEDIKDSLFVDYSKPIQMDLTDLLKSAIGDQDKDSNIGVIKFSCIGKRNV